MNISGFVPFDFSVGVPYISVTENGVTFNRSVTILLGYPEYIRVCVNESERLVFVEPGAHGEAGCVKYFNPGRRVDSVRLSGDSFIIFMMKMCGGDRGLGYKVTGEQTDGGIMFDMKKARPTTRWGE